MKLIDGKKYSEELISKYKKEISNLDIFLAIIQVGNDTPSNIYIRNKVNYCKSVGIDVEVYHLDGECKEELIDLINKLNENPKVTGIILQSPTPGIDFNEIIKLISSSKDVDGITKDNIYNLYMNKDTIMPCTVKGIIKLLDYYKINLEGSNITIIGRSTIVGKPLAMALENRNATVTLCHSKTKNLDLYTKNSDIIISAVGKANLITEKMVKKDFVGIDVGINRVNNKLCGDFDIESVKSKASYITPVPGGIGPVTVAMIVDNLIFMKKTKF